VKFDIIISFP